VIELLREASRATSGVKTLERGTLQVGASTTPGTYLLPAILGRFHAAHPAIRLQLLIDNSREIERRVAAGQMDLGVIGDAPLIPDLAADRWIADELVLIVSRRHRLARRRSVEVSVLTRERYLAREPGSSTRETAERYLSRRGVRLVPEMELGSTEAVREAVAAGLGVALVSRLAVKNRAVVPLRIAGPRWTRDLLVIRRAGVPLSPAAERFRAMLLEMER
jgi:DNA-binding transcriptional LysR family regulator